MGEPHPLQSALDRVTTASYTIVDLLDIADKRMSRSATDRRGRPDGRQPSLYRAAITASVGGLEEATEALTAATLRAIGIPATAQPIIESLLANKMQNPNTENITALLRDYAGFSPSDHWSANLRGSQPAFKTLSSGAVEIHTFYNQDVSYKGKALAPIINRFVNIRHAFAHQDSSKSLLNQQELKKWFGPLRLAKASTAAEREFVIALSTVCKVRLNGSSQDVDPVHSWTVLDTHAANALHLLLGVTASLTNALADYLAAEHAVAVGDYDPLELRVQRGAWTASLHQARVPQHPHVDLVLTDYAPGTR